MAITRFSFLVLTIHNLVFKEHKAQDIQMLNAFILLCLFLHIVKDQNDLSKLNKNRNVNF